jgi:hypothetical protein
MIKASSYFCGLPLFFCLSVWTNSLEEVAYESVKLFLEATYFFA